MFDMAAHQSDQSGTFRKIKTTLTVALCCLCFRKDVDPEEKIEFKTRLGESQHLFM